MKTARSWAVVAILFLLIPGAAQSASEYHRQSLRGLTGVTVRIDSTDEAATQAGVTEQALATIVKDKLGAAGIKVFTDRGTEAPGNAVLYVRVHVTPVTAGYSYVPVYAAKITVALLQDAAAARDSSVELREAKTWDAGFLTAYSRPNLHQANDVVADLVDEFVNDWRAVNSSN